MLHLAAEHVFLASPRASYAADQRIARSLQQFIFVRKALGFDSLADPERHLVQDKARCPR